MEEGNTVLNAIIGGVIAIVTSFVPLSPVLGGFVAGYLEGGTRSDGIRVGAYAGLVALVPVGLFLAAALFLIPAGAFFGGTDALIGIGFGLVVVVFVAVVAVVYTVGASALGGWLGNYVKYDTDLL